MTKPTQNAQIYLKFLNLVTAIREIPAFPQLDSVEERLLNLFARTWETNQKISVLEAMAIMPDISPTTAHRRLKTLRQKGLIALNGDEVDNRIKYVVPTDLTTQYFNQLGEYFQRAQTGN